MERGSARKLAYTQGQRQREWGGTATGDTGREHEASIVTLADAYMHTSSNAQARTSALQPHSCQTHPRPYISRLLLLLRALLRLLLAQAGWREDCPSSGVLGRECSAPRGGAHRHA
eukprot:1438202-Pleurochrysis_carterae.AAC.1